MGMGNVRALCSSATSHDHGRRSNENGTVANVSMHRRVWEGVGCGGSLDMGAHLRGWFVAGRVLRIVVD